MLKFADYAEERRWHLEQINAELVCRLRKFYGLCQRCGVRPHDGSRIMCVACWQELGPWDREITG